MASGMDNSQIWREKQQEIDEFVLSALTRQKGASVTTLSGPHGCGKSTDMMMHLVELANQFSDVRILKLVEHSFQSETLMKHYSSDVFASIPKTVSAKAIDFDVGGTYLRVANFAQFFAALASGNLTSFQGESVVVFQASLYPGPLEEWVLGKVLERIKDEGKVRSVALIVIYAATGMRMHNALEAYLEIEAQTIHIEHRMKSPKLEEDNNLQNNLLDLRSRFPNTNMVISGCLGDKGMASLSHLKPYILSPRRVLPYPYTSQLFQRKGLAIIDSSLHLAAYQPNVRVMAVTGEVRDYVFDKDAAQVVLSRRKMTRIEVMSQFSWTAKTDCDPSDTLIRHSFSTRDYEARPARSDEHDPAHVRDVLVYVLGCVALWPGTDFRSMPARLGPDDFVLEEALHRLRTLGLLEFDYLSGLYGLTQTGSNAWSCMAATSGACGFELSYLFSTVANEHERPMSLNTKAVIIRITALLLVGLNNFLLDSPEMSDEDKEALRELCVGAGKDNFDKGVVWVALGLWEAIEQEAENITALPSSVHKLGKFRLSVIAIHNVWLIQRELHHKSRVPYQTPADLSLDEVTSIERELMRGYLHRVIFVDSSQMRYDPQQYDVVSRKEVTVGEEFCDIEGLRDAETNGFLAIYEELSKTSDGTYHVSDVTYIPTKLYQELDSQHMLTGLPFPVCVAPVLPITN